VTSKTLSWRKSSHSGETNCVEMAALPDGNIAVRNSKHPTLGVTIFTRSEIDAFLQGAKAGEFDDMA
jgi:hypothetical protein